MRRNLLHFAGDVLEDCVPRLLSGFLEVTARVRDVLCRLVKLLLRPLLQAPLRIGIPPA